MNVGYGREEEEAEAVGWSLLRSAGRWHCYISLSVKVALDTRGPFRVHLTGRDPAYSPCDIGLAGLQHRPETD